MTQMKPPLSPLVDKYLLQWKKDPKGHAFAPLAEAYRRSGLHKEALQTLARGLKIHPQYLLGYLVMAEVLADEDKWDEVYKILRPFAQVHFDNIKLQSLFAKAAYKNYSMTEALQSYKCVLFLDPNNQEVRLKIRELEENDKNYYAYLNKEIPLKARPNETSKNEDSLESANDWSTIGGIKFDDEFLEEEVEEFADWSVRKDNISLNPQQGLPEIIETPILKKSNSVVQPPITEIDVSIPEEFNTIEGELPEVIGEEVDFESESQSEAVSNLSGPYDELTEGEEIPIVTHTLIDLYFAQKHYDKARDLLLKVLKHDPQDERSRDKLKKIEQVTGKSVVLPEVRNAPPVKQARSKGPSISEDEFQKISQTYQQYLKELKKHFWKK